MKAILVIDMPEKCIYCPVYDNDGIYPCKAIDIEETEDYNELTIPSWCPLKPMPEKKEIKEVPIYLNDLLDFDRGWNACIDEILGEEE